MSDPSNAKSTSLSPELQVFANISPLWFKRFDRLARHIWEHLDEPLPVEQLAEITHLSTYHFHRMFGSAFGEPIGSYIRRARLIKATGELLETDKSVTNIAIDCGFSSSQAFAKALKKQTNMTSTQVRQSVSQPGMVDMLRLHSSLGRPASGEAIISQEQKMAKEMELILQSETDRYYRCTNVEKPTMDSTLKTWKKNTSEKDGPMISITFAQGESMAFDEMEVWVGDECSKQESTHTLPAGDYLSARIKVTSTLGYFSAWEALGNYVMQIGREFDSESPMLEITHNPRAFLEAIDMTLFARLIKEEK